MLKKFLCALPLIALLGCGGSDAGATTDLREDPGAGGATTAPTQGCPFGGQEPVEGEDGVYADCAVLFEGCCFAETANACQAAGCGDTCDVMESDPGQINRCAASAPSCPAGGVPPVLDENGLPENCAVLFEGCCFADGSDACRAAGCGDECAIAESYPGQLGRCE